MSPAATETAEASRRDVLRAADDLFYARGVGGVTMADVRDRSGVSMRRLYTMYPSKDALVGAWLTDRHETWMTWFTEAVERHAGNGTDALLATFDALGEWIADPRYRGCAFINSMAETHDIDETHRAIIAGHKSDLIRHLGALVRRSHPDAAVWLAPALGVILDGAIVQCAIFHTTEPLSAARSAAARLIETIPT